MREVYSISAYIQNSYLASEAGKYQSNIERNIFSNKWILKINEKNVGNKVDQRRVFYTAIVVIVILILSALILSIILESNFVIFRLPIQIDIKENLSTNMIIEDNKPTVKTVLEKIEWKSSEANNCGRKCKSNEICLQRLGDVYGKCTLVLDFRDPTGCGGNCLLEVEYCREIKKGSKIFQCLPSKRRLENCAIGNFNCADLCLNSTDVCDGIVHCVDFSDEKSCVCNDTTHFKCGDDISCLPNSFKCNGIVDCWDGSDEIDCGFPCDGVDKFLCLDSTKCLDVMKFCDGVPDCMDHSDEPLGCVGTKYRL